MKRFFAILAFGAASCLVITGCDSQSTFTNSGETSVSQEQQNSTRTTSTQNTTHEQRLFLVKQGDKCFCVTALSHGGETVAEFYDYRRPHSHTSTDIERSMVSNLFLFAGPHGTSLVALHDEPDDQHGTDDGGGAASFDFTGLPTTSGQWVVKDDPGELSDTDTSPDWAWAEQHTDGGAWRGGLDGDFSIGIDPGFNDDATRDPLNPGTIDAWHVLSGDATSPVRVSLTLDEPVSISTKCTRINIDIKPGSDPNAFNPDGEGLIPVAVLHTEDFDPSTVDVSTVRFGDPEDVGVINGIYTSEDDGGAAPAHSGHLEDVDNDGDDELVLHFPIEDTDFEGDEEEGLLVGKTTDGTKLFGVDSVKLTGG